MRLVWSFSSLFASSWSLMVDALYSSCAALTVTMHLAGKVCSLQGCKAAFDPASACKTSLAHMGRNRTFSMELTLGGCRDAL